MPAPTIQPQRVSFDRDAVSELISYLSFAKALPACKGARGSSKERRRCRACKLCCPKGPPSRVLLGWRANDRQEGRVRHRPGSRKRHLAIDPKDGALFVGVDFSGNIGVEPEIKASIQRSVELPRQSSATSRTII